MAARPGEHLQCWASAAPASPVVQGDEALRETRAIDAYNDNAFNAAQYATEEEEDQIYNAAENAELWELQQRAAAGLRELEQQERRGRDRPARDGGDSSDDEEMPQLCVVCPLCGDEGNPDSESGRCISCSALGVSSADLPLLASLGTAGMHAEDRAEEPPPARPWWGPRSSDELAAKALQTG